MGSRWRIFSRCRARCAIPRAPQRVLERTHMSNSMRALFQAVESPRSAARLNVASGSEHFLRLLSQDPVVRELLADATIRSQAEDVLRRLLHLAQQCVDPRYENPFASALAAYLLVLHSTHLDLARIAAEAVRATARNCWWAERTAREALKRETTSGEPAGVNIPASSGSAWQLAIITLDTDTPFSIADYASNHLRQFGSLAFIPLEERNSAQSGSELTGFGPPYFSADNSDRPADAA